MNGGVKDEDSSSVDQPFFTNLLMKALRAVEFKIKDATYRVGMKGSLKGIQISTSCLFHRAIRFCISYIIM